MSFEPIAIIGMSCRFPGAEDLNAYWQLLQLGKIAISDIPEDRWDIEHYYDEVPMTPGKMYTQRGGFLAQIDQFDAEFFGISAQEAKYMDPQQRMMLEVAWNSLEDAAISPNSLANTQTGVFVGISTYDYNRLISQELSEPPAQVSSGCNLGLAANRISHALNLKGPSLGIDTACSSALVALHHACQSLANQESNLCLVGGVNAILSREPNISFSQAQALSLDDCCAPFSAKANGYVRGEGCGVVVLKRLVDAQQEGDLIQAVIRGSAVNHNGLTSGLTAPNGLAQQAVIRQALSVADIKPAQISYVETHAVGTVMGDAIEVNALKAVLTEDRADTQPCWMGTNKPNIGHLEAAAGMANLIKVVLALRHQQIPPHPNLTALNPYIKIKQTPLSIATTLQPWPAGTDTRIAGVSSFGFGGANAHIIVEDPPTSQAEGLAEPKVSSAASTSEASTSDQAVARLLDRPLHLLTLSAKNEQALQALGKRYQAFLQTVKDENLSDICFSANIGRTHFKYRLALVADSIEQFIQQLQAFEQGQESAGLFFGSLICSAMSHRQTNTDLSNTDLSNTDPSKKSDSEKEISLETIAQQYVQDKSIDWANLYQDQPVHKVALPTYPWQRQRYWFEPKSTPPISPRTQPAETTVLKRELPALAEPTPPSTKANELTAWLRHYASERINSRLIDERRCIPPHIVLDFGDRGLFGLQVPPEYGGLGLNTQDTLRVIEQLGAIDQTLTLLVGNHNALGIRPIMNWATESVRQQWLPQLATGRKLGAFALTEPGAGSNPRALAAQAIAQANDRWLLKGTKIWSGSAAWAGAVNVFVQHLDAKGNAQGISGFVVPQESQGLRQGPEALTMGMRGMVQNTVFLEGVPVQAEQLLGEAGNGMAVAQDAMMQGRLGLAAGCLGGMKRCAQLMWRYGSRRTVSSGLLLDNAVTQTRLTGLTHAIAALESLVFIVAELIDRGVAVPEEAYIACKTIGPEFFWQAADQLVQLMGGRGYIETNIAPQILRDARVFRIFEGPTETLNMFLGSRVVNQGETLFHFLHDTLGATDIAECLRQATEKIQVQSQRSQLSRKLARQWAYVSIGEVASLAILMATVQMADKRALTSELAPELGKTLEQTLAWCDRQLEQKLETLLAHEPAVHIYTSAHTLTHKIASYADTIGDVTQQSEGENYQLDEFLLDKFLLDKFPQASVSQPSSTSVQTANIQTARPQSQPPQIQSAQHKSQCETDQCETDQALSSHPIAYTAENIQTWIAQWLAKALDVEATLDRSISFADYGMDSVTGIELIHDLEDWLQQSLEVTALWNFPTIEALGKHLAESVADVGSLNNSLENLNNVDSERDRLSTTVLSAQSISIIEPAPIATAANSTLSADISQELLALERLLEA